MKSWICFTETSAYFHPESHNTGDSYFDNVASCFFMQMSIQWIWSSASTTTYLVLWNAKVTWQDMSATLFSGDSLDLVWAITLLNKSLEISLFVNIEKYINRMNINLRIYVPIVEFGWTIHVLDLSNPCLSSEVVHVLTSNKTSQQLWLIWWL